MVGMDNVARGSQNGRFSSMTAFRTNICLALLMASCSGGFTWTAEPPEHLRAEQAVDRALEYLQHSQGSEGYWRSRASRNPAITGLAVMAFLSAGHVPGEGPYGDTVEKGVRWLLA